MAHREAIDHETDWDDVRQRIARWRETRTHRGAPMPAALWATAVRLARRHGVGPTARALRVDHGTLKIHVAAATGDEAVERPTFVEVRALPPAVRGRSVMVIEGSRDRRLRLEVADLAVPDLVALLQAAWGAAR